MFPWLSCRQADAVGLSGFAEETDVGLWERPWDGSALSSFPPAEYLISPLSSKISRCSSWRDLLQVFLLGLK